MRRGELAEVVRETVGHRPMTREEQDEWHAAQVRPHGGPIDWVGEPWGHRGVATLVLDAGARFMVLLGRVSWHDRPGYAEVVGGDGVVLWVPRADLVVVRPERGTPSVPTTSQ